MSVKMDFGIPQHFNNDCDGQHGILKGRLHEYSKKYPVSDISELVFLWEMMYLDGKDRNPSMLPETVVDFVPPPRHLVKQNTVTFSKKSYPVPIMSCFSWTAAQCDKRRAPTAKGAGLNAGILTNIELRSNLISGYQAANDRTVNPVLADDLQEDAEAADGLEEGTSLYRALRSERGAHFWGWARWAKNAFIPRS